jgi:plastocyanin
MKRLPLLLVICVFSIAGLAACGGDDDGGSDTATEPAATATDEGATGGAGGAGGGGTVEVSADPGGALEFEQRSLTAPAGRATFEFTNQSSTPHDFVLEQDGNEIAKTEVITDGTDTAQATLEAGEYTYFCSVPGHRQAGMEGTLTAE